MGPVSLCSCIPRLGHCITSANLILYITVTQSWLLYRFNVAQASPCSISSGPDHCTAVGTQHDESKYLQILQQFPLRTCSPHSLDPGDAVFRPPAFHICLLLPMPFALGPVQYLQQYLQPSACPPDGNFRGCPTSGVAQGVLKRIEVASASVTQSLIDLCC